MAADGIKLGVGGFFSQAYMVVFDDDSEGEPGNERNTDGLFNSAEIHFSGSTVLDNGLEVGAHVELEGEDEDDQIDEAWIFFSGGFGELRIGSIDDALSYSCILPPGATGNFSAFSPDQWGANTLISNPACVGVDESDGGDAQKLLYFSPTFAGFQLAAVLHAQRRRPDPRRRRWPAPGHAVQLRRRIAPQRVRLPDLHLPGRRLGL